MRAYLWKLSGAALALAGAAAAMAQETGFSGGPVYSTTVNGDYVVAGSSTRNSSTGQPDPFGLTVAGVPGGATVVKAFAAWNHLTYSPGDLSDSTITINGFGVAGALMGTGTPDLCWGRTSGAAYLADVTGIVTGNGVYSIGGAVDDPATGSLGEGITLLLIYDDGGPARTVDVFSGYTSSTSQPGGPGAFTTWTLSGAYTGGAAHFFANGLDGQFADDDFYVNGFESSALTGGTPTDAWQGLIGPGPASSNYYDHAEGDISGLMGLGDTSLTMLTATPEFDCIGQSFGALSYIPEPATLALLALGALALRRR